MLFILKSRIYIDFTKSKNLNYLSDFKCVLAFIMTSVVQTVTGDVDPKVLGRTLTHEHLSMNFGHFYRRPSTQLSDVQFENITLESLGYIKQYPYSSKNNLILNDSNASDAVRRDLFAYRRYGGGTIVENTTEGMDRNLGYLWQVSGLTSVKIVAGTGFYIADTQAANHLYYSKEGVYNHMHHELVKGNNVTCTSDSYDLFAKIIKAGFIGEIASVWPLRVFERKVIKAAGEVQEQVGCGVNFHPHPVSEAPFEIIRLYLEAGGRADKAAMSHLDLTLLDNEKLLEFSELNTYCQFDLFGNEVSYYQLDMETDMPSDSQRIEKIQLLVDDGKETKVLMSHDIHTKHRLLAYGGHGYSHILNNVLPKMMYKGISQETIDKITIKNPAEWLSIKK